MITLKHRSCGAAPVFFSLDIRLALNAAVKMLNEAVSALKAAPPVLKTVPLPLKAAPPMLNDELPALNPASRPAHFYPPPLRHIHTKVKLKECIMMTTHQWQVSETFYFPENCGACTTADDIKITPGFTETKTGESIFLQGIYHIAAMISFDETKQVQRDNENLVVIDDVEVSNQNGYFEYAVPLHVDLPADTAGAIELLVESIEAQPQTDGGLKLTWDVALSQAQPPQTETAAAADTAAADGGQALESPSTSSVQLAAADSGDDMTDFMRYIASLDDDVTKKIFHSNNVFVEAE